MNQSMWALRLHERGGPEQLAYEQAPRPYVGAGDALVRVHAASFTPTELTWSSIWVDHAGHDRRPIIPAHEVSGVVEGLGYGTVGVSVGEAVYGLTDWYRDGAAAEYVAVEAHNLAPKPRSLSHVEAAAVPLGGLTAWQALFDYGRVVAGQHVLIHGAGGGVGVFALQLAGAAGAEVIGTGRAWAREVVTELGAVSFIDVERERFEDVVGQVDLVFDLVGGEMLERSWSVLKPGGVLVSVVEDPNESAHARRPDARGVFFVVQADRAELGELAGRIDAGQLRPIVGNVLPLARGREAFERKHAGGSPGQTVLKVDDTDELGASMTRFDDYPQYRSKVDMLQLLRRLGYPGEMIAEIDAKLPDTVELHEACPLLQQYGLTRDALISRLGGSP
jgi:NADPH:quinone reductase-like Zn-dependent oxidoreductase